MALQKRVSELPAVSQVAGTDLLIVSSNNATKRTTVAQIGAYFQANGVAGPPGERGEPGPAGATGPQGPQGPAGSNATATTDASALVTGTLPFARLPYTVVFPVRAVNVGGILGFNNWGASASPTYFWGGSTGDLRTLATMDYPATSVAVDVSQSVAKFIADNPGRTLTYASLEIALVDAANRIVGWGSTATLASVGPSHGTAGTSMTVSLFEFPTHNNGWILGGNSAGATANSGDLMPFAAFKLAQSRHLDQDRTDWGNIPNKPATFPPTAHQHAAGDVNGLQAALDARAPIANPTFTGTVGGITKAMVGLGNVDNTSDASKPVSTAQAAADAAVASAAAADATSKANAAQAYAIQRANHTGTQPISTVSGLQAALDSKQPVGTYATLVNGLVPSSQLPSYVDDVIEAANLAALPGTGEAGKIYVTIDSNKTYRWSGTTYVEISASPGSTDVVPEGSVNLYYTNARASAAAPVQSVAGKTGTVTLVKADVGLSNVDNTSDASKPVSTAQAAADAAVASAAAADATSKANAAQAAAVQRANHTGTQPASTISDFAAAVAAAAPVTSVDGATGAVTVTKATIYEFTRTSGPPGANWDAVNSRWTWTIPAGARLMECLLIGGGGGGGSGRRGAADTARWGGGGGAGGHVVWTTVPASFFASSILVQVPAGGAGGAARTTDDTNGANGTTGLNALIITGGVNVLGANGGSGGSGGSATSGFGGNPSGIVNRTYSGGTGGSSSVTANAAGTVHTGGISPIGGGAGGGIGTNNVAYNGAQSGSVFGAYWYQAVTTSPRGGNASITANAQAGESATIYGGGGCGGGASLNGFNSGAGGNGGDGFVRITVWS